ncbi:hypothetical protein D4R78_03990 [bacterium]|nr:MAG: hypothetical protein D4R78_03990 [bacterium]
MARLLFSKGKQREFLIRNRSKLANNRIDMAKICNVHPRTLYDWEREKFKMDQESAVKLEKLTGILLPKTANLLPEFWNCSSAGRLGAKARRILYGNPGTPEGRRKGGQRTIQIFTQNPGLAKKRGFITRKIINYPQKCPELAELFGIILGDGGLSGRHQLTISFNNETDREYSHYLKGLLRKLFVLDSYIHYRKNNNGADIVTSSSNLVDFLLRHGLVIGNKVKNQVDIPDWIYKKIEYQKACLRGLVDTDGSFYLHKYSSNGKNYKYLKLCFTNASIPLLNSVLRIFKRLNFNAYLQGDHGSIYSKSGIQKYFREIGTHNPKHFNKINKFLLN